MAESKIIILTNKSAVIMSAELKECDIKYNAKDETIKVVGKVKKMEKYIKKVKNEKK